MDSATVYKNKKKKLLAAPYLRLNPHRVPNSVKAQRDKRNGNSAKWFTAM